MGGARGGAELVRRQRLLQARRRRECAGLCEEGRGKLPFALATTLRSATAFTILPSRKLLSKAFYRHDFEFVGDVPPGDPWKGLRLVVFLNLTSLFEPVFLGMTPARFIWRLAAHGVVPAADKTTDRPLVGMVFKFIAHRVKIGRAHV